MTRGSKWELDVYNALRGRGYDVVHAMAQYQEQLCDLQVSGNDSKSIYIECKSTKGNKVSLNRNKHVREQYLRFCELSARHGSRAFYAVRFYEGTSGQVERYYQMPVRRSSMKGSEAMVVHPADGLENMPFGLDGPAQSPINPPICPPVDDLASVTTTEERYVDMRGPVRNG